MSLYLKDLLQMSENRFRDENCSDPRLDAELLLCYFLKVDKTYIFLHYGEALDDRLCQGFLELVDRRAAGEPVQYITGKQEFMGLEFSVNESVLIPRQDTELLAEAALEELEGRKGTPEILDLCCGSGALAVSLGCLHKGKAKITASDISGDALAVARKNAEGNKQGNRVTFVESDLFEAFPKNKKGIGKKRFDLIVCNPPYIPDSVLETLQREVREHEPMLALSGGADGLDFYRRILEDAPAYLATGGVLMMEIGHDQGTALKELAEAAGVYEPAEIRPDLNGHDRLCILKCLPVEKKRR